jgi:acetyl esterase/lipase
MPENVGDEAFCAAGGMGQTCYVNPKHNVVIVMFCSWPWHLTALTERQWHGCSQIAQIIGSQAVATPDDKRTIGLGQDAESPYEPIPSTISMDAQEYLLRAPAIPPFLQNRGGIVRQRTKEECTRIQADFDEKWADLSTSLERECEATVDADKIAGVDVRIITPKGYDRSRDEFALIWIHGGGFVIGSPESTHGGGVRVATYSGTKVYSIGYRLAPQHPYPAGLDDCLAVYRSLLGTYKASRIGVFGGSAGGNLALSMVLKARDQRLALPGAVVAISPWSDLTNTGDSYSTLLGQDPILHSYEAIEWCVHAYVDQVDLRRPLLSPVYADYRTGFPPTLVQTGTRDLFLSNCTRLYRKMKDDGVDVELSVWEGMWHGFVDESFAEAKDSSREVADYFRRQLR